MKKLTSLHTNAGDTMLRLIIMMLHDIVKKNAERMTDHELMRRGLDVWTIDSDGHDVMSIYSMMYKKERARIVALMSLAWTEYQSLIYSGKDKKFLSRRIKSKSEYYMMWLSRYDESSDESVIGKRIPSNVTWNSGSQNFDIFSNDVTSVGKTVKAYEIAKSKWQAEVRARHEVRGYQVSKKWRYVEH